MDLDDLDLRQLDAFAAVMSAGSITGAARLLGRSQPATTRLIQDLETSLGYALFHRSGPRISPTEQGVLFHEEVERLLVSIRHIRERAQAIGRGDARPFEIAATPALSIGLVPDALAMLEPHLLPRLLHVQSLSAEHVVQSLLARAADFGVASLPIEHPGIDVHWVGEAPCVAAVPAGSPLAAQEMVRIADLAGQCIITMANPYRLRRRIDEALAQAGVVPERMIDTNASLAALAMARAGLGIAIVEPATACGLCPEGLVLRPLDVNIPFLFGTLSPTAKPLSATIVAFNDALQAVAARRLPGFRLHEPGRKDTLADAVYGATATATAPAAPAISKRGSAR